MNTNREEEWEKQFGNRTQDAYIKAFIKSLLQSERKRMGESIPLFRAGLLEDWETSQHRDGYNQALKEVRDSLINNSR